MTRCFPWARSSSTFALAASRSAVNVAGFPRRPGRRLAGAVQVRPGSRKLALHLLDRGLVATGTLRLCLGAALVRASTPFRLGPGLPLSPLTTASRSCWTCRNCTPADSMSACSSAASA
ncbi:hypothetical protein [Arthrobacter sp. StoSoilB13]|uniref:hypothetical protein n=1 Tax=Arthrobacter sp. StoSoilB13 TaxID=2830993 RepID=UPI001CC6CA92|nr:hypothetical protein [Arthrobacter sp. StoSoilB13]